MKVKRNNPLTGKVNELELDITTEQLNELNKPSWAQRRNVQDIVPHLTADEREFLISGFMPGEFEARMPKEEEPAVETVCGGLKVHTFPAFPEGNT